MLANASPAIVSLIDTWVVGQFAGTIALAAIGLGVVVYGIFYWGFGFLRMSTAGLSAQADGAGDTRAVQAHLYRAVPMGFAIGLSILLLQSLIVVPLVSIYPAETAVAAGAKTYLHARLFGLPATLANIALMGWFIGLARPRLALYLQIVLNLINAPLSIYMAGSLGMGLYGVGLASSIAEWCGLAMGLILAAGEIKRRGGFDKIAMSIETLLDTPSLRKLATANTNIFIRTMALTVGFSFFSYAATQQGTVFLAAHNVLLQFITMIALVLDGFAHVAEAHVGAAYGAKSRTRFNRAVRLTTEFSFIFALICGAVTYFAGPFFINLISDDPLVVTTAIKYLPLCALAPVVGFLAWQMDGIYIGITRTAAMRNAGIAAVLIYLSAHYVLEPMMGAAGVWTAFLIYYVARAITMMPAWPAIQKELRAA